MLIVLRFYQLAFWFKIFGESETSLKLFYVFLSMGGLPLIYWTFGNWQVPCGAFNPLLILAIMRWHIIFSRNAFRPFKSALYIWYIGFSDLWN
jgi:uncharacterized membrane protein